MQSRILVIPDVHIPNHRNTFFKDLEKVLKKHNPSRVVQIGDLITSHSISRFQPSPDSPGPSEEIELSIKYIHKLSEILRGKKVTWILGNHEAKIYKQAAKVMIPSGCILGLKDIYKAPKSWKVTKEAVIDGVMFFHGKSSVNGKSAMAYGMPVVFGHYHHKFGINYFSSGKNTVWEMCVGSAGDDNSEDMKYASNNVFKSVYGFGLIENGIPRLIPMY